MDRVAWHRSEHRMGELAQLETFNSRYNHLPAPESRNRQSYQATISRKKIISSSQLEDIWFDKDQLIEDHVREVIAKMEHIDDEIWAKIVYMEYNKRIAKAYVRAPAFTIDGSDDVFDGYRLGLCSFSNSVFGAKADDLKRSVGHGVKLQMENFGSILVESMTSSNVYVHQFVNNLPVWMPPLKKLEFKVPVKLFDFDNFVDDVTTQLRQPFPDYSKLKRKSVSAISFANCDNLLDSPCWVLIINVVALEMLKSKMSSIPGFFMKSRDERLNVYQTLDTISRPGNSRSYENCYSEGAVRASLGDLQLGHRVRSWK